MKTVEIPSAAGLSTFPVEWSNDIAKGGRYIMDDKALREEVLRRETVYPGKIIRVEQWQVRLPNGETAQREIAVSYTHLTLPTILRV